VIVEGGGVLVKSDCRSVNAAIAMDCNPVGGMTDHLDGVDDSWSLERSLQLCVGTGLQLNDFRLSGLR
jgi:hypothetical protein